MEEIDFGTAYTGLGDKYLQTTHINTIVFNDQLRI